MNPAPKPKPLLGLNLAEIKFIAKFVDNNIVTYAVDGAICTLCGGEDVVKMGDVEHKETCLYVRMHKALKYSGETA